MATNTTFQAAVDWFTSLSNIIDDKLKTPTGKLTLVIINCLILGGALVHSWNVSSNLETAAKARDKQTTKADSLQTAINTFMATENERCNDNLRKGALFQQQMQVIYDQKRQENYRIAEENARIIKEREATAKAKLENIKTLTNLKNR